MSTNKYYTIVVPNRQIAPSFENALDKETMLPIGDPIKVHPVLGWVHIPNFSRVWGARHLAANGTPTGKITFLPWGDDLKEGNKLIKGEVIEIRWLRNSNSLDKNYQTTIQKLTVPDEDTFLRLKTGENEIDTEKEPMLCEFYKHHTFNGDSPCRDPRNKNILFTNYRADENLKNSIAARKEKQAVVDIVLDAEFNGHLTVLAKMFGLDPQSESDAITRGLLEIVDQPAMPGIIAGYVNFKNIYQETLLEIEKELRECAHEGILKGEEGKLVSFVNLEGRPEPIFEGAEQVGDSTVKFFMDNILKEQFYDAYVNLKPILLEARKLVLN